MAGGPIFPSSSVPVTASRVFPYIYAISTSPHREGLGVEASVGADSTWRLHFQMPPALPTGTAKLRLLAVANATSGAAKVNPKWASVAVAEVINPTLNAEGTQTVTWAAGDNDKIKELKVILDADAGGVVASEVIVMDLVFETTSWTLAQISIWTPSVIWE